MILWIDRFMINEGHNIRCNMKVWWDDGHWWNIDRFLVAISVYLIDALSRYTTLEKKMHDTLDHTWPAIFLLLLRLQRSTCALHANLSWLYSCRFFVASHAATQWETRIGFTLEWNGNACMLCVSLFLFLFSVMMIFVHQLDPFISVDGICEQLNNGW